MTSTWNDIDVAIIAAERTLLDPAIRTDRAVLERWLAPEFTEIGQSGTFWTRDAVLHDLTTTDQTIYAEAVLTEPRVTRLGHDLFLLTYVVEIGDRRSRRSSIWRQTGGQLRMVFNQGTPLTR
ncbi:MAG: nuclear transport factor 2 family protein [Thermomicrobiales bacterium]|nr:nuclear transport factor 2 family protein [Thermomicrobiales bacterium]MCO5223003.1 nuclear transport factor 2 family protein [Thermomicrobiales bacterium]